MHKNCAKLALDSRRRKGFKKQNRARPMDLRPAPRECVSQEDFPVRVTKTAAYTRRLSGPVRAGASKNQGAFRLKLD